jgi:hypothetical protein
VLGVDWVAVALPAPLALAGRTGDLEHHDPMAAQEPGQPEPVGAGPFHPERRHATQTGRPGEQVGVAAGRRGSEPFAQPAPEPVERDRDVLIFVGVDPTMTSAGSDAMLAMLSVPSVATAKLAGRRGGTGLRWDLL